MLYFRINLSEIYGLEEKNDNAETSEDITDEIDKQLAQTKRVRVVSSGSTAEKRIESRLSALKATIAILLLLAALQIGAASYLFITQG